jgi:NitT/TauT family transport system substrate-binding protein
VQHGEHHNRSRAFSILAALAGLLLMALPVPALALDKVSLQLHWVHQAQFAGFYMAKDAGLYKEVGLEVEIIPGGPGINSLDNLRDGKCDFATAWLIGAMECRSKGVPVVLMSQIIQRSAMLLVTFEDSDIDSVKDMNGHRVGLWGGHFSILPKALFKREGIKIKKIPQNFSMAPFLRHAVAAASAMYYNELHQLYQAGVDYDELQVFEFANLGLNFPEDGIYTMQRLWNKEPGICHRFIEASLAGWRLSFEEPERALDLVMKRVGEANLASNKPHQRWMLKAMQELISDRVGLQGLGEMSAEDFDMVNKVLTDQGLIPAPVKLEDFYRPLGETQP